MSITMPGVNAVLPPRELREYRYHALDARIDVNTGMPEIEQIFHDNEDISREVNWEDTITKTVTGRVDAYSTRNEETLSASPFYCRKGEPVAAMLQWFDGQELEGDAIKRWYYEAKVDEDGFTLYAFKKLAIVKVTSVGGPATEADQVNFDLILAGAKIEQDFDLATGEFSDVT